MVIVTKQTVQVILEYLTKGVARANAAAKKTNEGIVRQQRGYAEATKQGRRMRDTVQRNAIAQSGFLKTMRMNREQLGKFNKQGYKFTSLGGRMANKLRMATHGARGFRMEMLGVMFFGMMLQKTFSGLIKTSLEWMGVMEVFSMALGILFLPVAGLLLKWALKFLKWVSELTPQQKKLINTIVLLGLAIGGILFVVGSFALGIGSLIMAFKFLFSPIGAILGVLLALAGISVYGMFDDLTNEIDGAGETIAGFGITGETLMKVKEKIWGVIKKVVETIVENFPLMLEKGKEILTNIVNGIHENIDKIADVTEQIIEAIVTWVAENSEKIVDIGIEIAGAIARGIGKGLKDRIPEAMIVGGMAGLGAIGGAVIGGPIGAAAGTAAGAAIGTGIATAVPKAADVIREDLKKTTAKPGFFERALGVYKAVSRTMSLATGLGIPFFQRGGIVPGRLGSPVPILAHAGERVTPANRVGGGREVILNVTYNVEVSDKEEMERLLRDNNLELVEEVKRLHAI